MKDDLIALHDILKEIDFLHSIRDRTTYEAFKESSCDVRAASFSIIVISEAVRRVPEDWLASHPETPWHAVKSIGNKLRHEYQRISDVILWGIVSKYSDDLKTVVEDMIGEQGQAKQ